jgi:hypothetical protein
MEVGDSGRWTMLTKNEENCLILLPKLLDT